MINYNTVEVKCPMCKGTFHIDKDNFLKKSFLMCPSCDLKIEGESLVKLQDTLKEINTLGAIFDGQKTFEISLVNNDSRQ